MELVFASPEVNQFNAAKEWIQETIEEHNISESDITFTGHSLGGAIAQYVTTIFDDASGVTFNAPGLMHKLLYNATNDEFNVRDLFKAITGQFDITNYVDEHDWLVGGFGVHIGKTVKLEGSFRLPQFELPHDISHYVNNWDILGMFWDIKTATEEWKLDLIKEFFIGSHGIDRFYDQFNEAGSAPPPPKDPIILDLDGDGLDTIGKGQGANYDHDGDGFAEETGWVGEGDGLLVFDRNGDGKYTDGSELFGDQTPLKNGSLASTGFEALEEFDTNKDGKIDQNDSQFTDLKIWMDKDKDGTAEEGETFTLAELGIRSLNTAYQNVNVEDGYGNTQIQLGQYEKNDGSIYDMGDYLVGINPEDSIPINYVEVPFEIRMLPDVFVGGYVHSLSQSMAMDQDGRLRQLVESFVHEVSLEGRNVLLKEIIFEWAGVQNIEENSRGEFIDAKELAALERFTGRKYIGVDGTPIPNENAANLLEQSFMELSDFIYSRMMTQSHLKEFSEYFEYIYNEEENTIEVGLSNVLTEIKALLSNDRVQGETLLIDFTRLVKSYDLQELMDFDNFRNVLISEDPSLSWIMDSVGIRKVEGTGDNDYLDGWMKDDAINGGHSNDNLDGNQGNDYLYGEGNDDYLPEEPVTK
ncbi:lipase family protein [Bacillus infantis]|uniref:lipase family protein n=1 Tax=Bacillus infantis TaxID=324767 RepID=UPI003CF6482B